MISKQQSVCLDELKDKRRHGLGSGGWGSGVQAKRLPSRRVRPEAPRVTLLLLQATQQRAARLTHRR